MSREQNSRRDIGDRSSHTRIGYPLDEPRSQRSQATRDREHALLKAIASIGSGLDLETTLHRVATLATDLVDARYGALGVLGEDGELARFIPVGFSQEEIARIEHWPRGEGLLGLLIHEPQTLRLSELSEHPKSHGFPKGRPPMQNFLGVPIQVHGKHFGNLYLTQKIGARDFTEEDEATVSALTEAAGVSIENIRTYEEMRTRATWLDASDEVTTRLLSGENTDSVLELIARRARVMAEADLVAIAVPTGDGDELAVEVADGELAHLVRARQAPMEGTLSGHAFRGGTSLTTESAEDATEPAALLSGTGTGPAAIVPLGSSQRVRGLLLLGRRDGRPCFSSSSMQMLHAFAGHAAVVMELADARRAGERLVVLEDRDRIARDLHDLIIQRLFATAMSLMGTTHRITDRESAKRVQRAVDDLDDTIRQIRSTIFALQSANDDDQPWLRDQVTDLVHDARASLGFGPNLRLDGPIDSQVPQEISEDVLAVVQEALSNIARHTTATQADVTLRVDGVVTVEVCDNGEGIAPDAARSGLRNLAHRAEAHNGSMEIGAAPEGGTCLRWWVPLPGANDSGAASPHG